jgi:hypothetical protein
MVSRVEADRQAIIDAVQRLPPDDLARMAEIVRSRSATPAASDPTTERLERLLGPRPSPEERVRAEVETTLRAFEERRALLQDSLTVAQVAQALGLSRQSVYARAERGDLLAATKGPHLRFPRWQFDPSSDDGVLPGLSTVVKELGARPALGKIAWFTSPRASLGGQTPLEVLRTGDLDRVLPAARPFALGE